MITKNIKPVKMIVQSERKKSNETARADIPNISQIPYVPYGKIMDYIGEIIKVERTEISVGIDKRP
jgi:hypothetical protein